MELNEIKEILASSNHHDKQTAIESVKNMAEKQDGMASYILATWIYSNEHGFEYDPKMIEHYLKIACDHLIPEALYDYGVYLSKIKKERRKGFSYYIAASIMGDTDAIYNVCQCLQEGSGAFKDADGARLILKIRELLIK